MIMIRYEQAEQVQAFESPAFGHNELTVRLSLLAADAQVALDRVAKGEGDTLDGWIAYGAALNEGRNLFPSDEKFGQWVSVSQLGRHADGREIKYDDRSAAMWAAANQSEFAEARLAGNARTVRGIHANWGRHGMVYWWVEKLKLLDTLEAIDGLVMASVEGVTRHSPSAKSRWEEPA